MDALALLEKVIALRHARRLAVLVTVVETRGSTPRKAGARMLVYPDGRIEGSIGGGAVEQAVRAVSERVLQTNTAELVTHALTTDLAMCCGGQMTFFVEPIQPKPTLMIFGCGHVGSAIAHTAQPLGFELVLVDDLPQNTAEFAGTCEIVSSFVPSDLAHLPFSEACFGVIATRDHGIDQRLLEFCMQYSWAYLGVIGSQRKAMMQQQRLAARGVESLHIERIRCPMGVAIGAETPAEIAVSVCAELIAVRRLGASYGRAAL